MSADATRNRFLRVHWDRMAATVNAEPAKSDTVWNDVMPRYNEAQRAYHNADHLVQLMSFIATYRHEPQVLAMMTAFVFFHDAVYRTDSLENIKKNEIASASLANDRLRDLGVKQEFSSRVTNWIMASASHKLDAKADPQGAFVLDADKSILAAQPDKYQEYCDNIRKEYELFDDRTFYAARLEKFIKPTLEAPKIFLTPQIDKALGERARTNLRLEALRISRKLQAA